MLDFERKFRGRRSQQKVAEFLMRNGIRISGEKLFANEIEIPDARVARVLDVDRRLIKAAISTIMGDEKLRGVFTKLGSTPLLKDIAPALGFGAIEIIPTNASSRGIVASVTGIISESGIAIRQIIADDPMFTNAELTVITEKPLPRELVDRMLKVKGVKKVVILS